MNRKGLWNIIFIAGAIGLGIGLSLKPWQVYQVQKAKAEQAQAEMRDAEQNRAELTRRKARYESSVGREELAREQGYHRPGETPVELGPKAEATD